MKYIDADKLIATLERQNVDKKVIQPLIRIIDSLQQEQPDFPTTDKEIERLLATHPKVEVPQKYKTPDWLWKKQGQPEGLHFTPLNRLIQKIPSEKWNNSTNNYAKKLRDCLIKEGYRKDAEVLQGYISYMNGNNVPMATMDEQEQPEVDLEKEIDSFVHGWSIDEFLGLVNDEGWSVTVGDIKNVARHFYELGRQAKPEVFDTVAFQKGVQEGRRLEREDALTIADIEKLHTFLYAVKNNKQGAFTFARLSDEQYEEVLRRFNNAKEK